MLDEIDLEKAQVMFKLLRKGNWNNVYDRTEHFKRFQNLDRVIKELSKMGWIIIHKKPQFTGLSLNTKLKSEIISFIGMNIPHVKEFLK